MPLPLVFRRRVGQDLAGAYGWYEEQRTGLGEEFLAAVDASFDAIEEFPEMCARVHGEVRRAMVSRFPYAVFYRIEANGVVVLAVLHTGRDPRLWPQPRTRGALTRRSIGPRARTSTFGSHGSGLPAAAQRHAVRR